MQVPDDGYINVRNKFKNIGIEIKQQVSSGLPYIIENLNKFIVEIIKKLHSNTKIYNNGRHSTYEQSILDMQY